jgi:outer membrane protein assembly factor BamD
MNKFLHRMMAIACLVFFCLTDTAAAYWIWTPATKKFINPKYASKDSPKEQFDWAMSFYDAKDYKRAAVEFEKLVKHYEYSEHASKAQYYVGLCYEQMGKYYAAFQNYQKAVENFPHIENIDEVIEREYNIANLYSAKDNPKVLGTDIMTATDRAVEIYKKVVENAPYGRLADKALFNMGSTLKKADRYDEAVEAFQKIVDDYKESDLAARAQYEAAYCAYRSSLKPAYAAEPTEKAIKAFEDFSKETTDKQLTEEADATLRRLKDKAAEKLVMTAEFYERIGQHQSAVVYYKEVLEKYPQGAFAEKAAGKIEELEKKIEKTRSKR